MSQRRVKNPDWPQSRIISDLPTVNIHTLPPGPLLQPAPDRCGRHSLCSRGVHLALAQPSHHTRHLVSMPAPQHVCSRAVQSTYSIIYVQRVKVAVIEPKTRGLNMVVLSTVQPEAIHVSATAMWITMLMCCTHDVCDLMHSFENVAPVKHANTNLQESLRACRLKRGA